MPRRNRLGRGSVMATARGVEAGITQATIGATGAGVKDKIDNGHSACSDDRGMLWRKPRLPSMARWPIREIWEP